MTNYNEQLDEVIRKIRGDDYGPMNYGSYAEAKQAILDWHNKQSELVEAIMELNNMGDDWDAQHIGELIAEWHKKHELEARIDELNSLPHRSVTALTSSVDQSVIYERLDELKKELERIESDD